MPTYGINKPSSSVLGDDLVDFSQYIKVIFQSKWKILTLAILVTICVAMFTMTLAPVYKASTSLLIDKNEAKVVSIQEVYGIDANKKEYFQTQYEIIKSRKVAEKVVAELNLVDHPLYNKTKEPSFDLRKFIKENIPFLPDSGVAEKELTAESEQQIKFNKVVVSFMKALSVVPVKNTQVVVITFESESASLAAQVANTVAEVYINSYLDAKMEMTSKATEWLNNSLQDLRDSLEKSEQELADFYESEKLINLDGVVGLTGEQVQGLSQELLDAENQLKQNRTIYEQIQRSNGDIQTLSQMSEVLNHPSIQDLRLAELAAERKVSELAEVYGPKHQRMISANAELVTVKSNMEKQIRSLASGITADYRQAQQRVSSLKASLDAAKQDFRQLGNLDSRQKQLQREVDVNQQLYDSFFTRLKETSQIEGFSSQNARVLDSAVPPRLPSKPKKSVIIVLAFIFSTIVGMGLAILLDVLNKGISTADEVEKKLGQRLIGIIPQQKVKRGRLMPLRRFFDSNHHSFSEAVRTLRTSLQLMRVGQKQQVIMVTSSVPQEGKTTCSINLSFALGQLGKTLLIEADLRKPSICKQFGFPGFQPGLSNLMSNTHNVQEVVVTDMPSGIDIITAGSIPSNPQELLASSKFSKLMDHFRSVYEYIVIDTAPVQAVSDAMVVSGESDSIVYVVRADSTSENLVNNALTRFMEAGKRVDGVVLSQVPIKLIKNNEDYAGFYDKYGYETKPQSQS